MCGLREILEEGGGVAVDASEGSVISMKNVSRRVSPGVGGGSDGFSDRASRSRELFLYSTPLSLLGLRSLKPAHPFKKKKRKQVIKSEHITERKY